MINVTMTQAQALSTIELIGEIREIATGSFTINNPFNVDVVIPKEQIILENEYLSISSESISIPEESQVTVDVSFLPLIVGKTNTNTIIKSPQLEN